MAQAPVTFRGFTLLELVAVVAIVAILLSIALPSYQSVMLRVHRSEAIVELMNIAACQERIYAANGSFDTSRCINEGIDHYSFRIDPAGTVSSLAFTAWAVPSGKQVHDDCGSLALDQTGFRQASGNNAKVEQCWQIR